jgi:SAM-dependent methyltransferase
MTAFGRAMLDTINGFPQQFMMIMDGGPPLRMKCEDFLSLRQDEKDLLNQFTLSDTSNVLDYGCGVGRHLSYIREMYPQVHCFGIELCDLLRDYCNNSIANPSIFVQSLDELNGKEFDLIMLMGNGLGVLGDENNAEDALGVLVQSLSSKGCILIETGNPFGAGYLSTQLSIKYDDMEDDPFTWGCADSDWISQKLRNYGCAVEIWPSQAPGGMFFFAIGRMA